MSPKTVSALAVVTQLGSDIQWLHFFPVMRLNHIRIVYFFSMNFCTSEKILTFKWYGNASSPYMSFLRFKLGMSEKE